MPMAWNMLPGSQGKTCRQKMQKMQQESRDKRPSFIQASFIYEQRPIGHCGPRRPKQQRPRGSQPSCDMDADQL